MSQEALSADTEVVLLTCGRFGGEGQEPFKPLSAREYGEFAKWLNLRGLRPADLLSGPGREQLSHVHEVKLEQKRVDFLLARGTALALALERWSRGGLWVISRGDPEFPKRLKRHLKHLAPPLLYGAGNKSLLDVGGLAIIGSRDATERALEFTRTIGAKCAAEGIAVVSGGARGVDAAAMQGATEAGGVSIGVLASDLLKTSLSRQNRIGLQEGRLVLVSPFYPDAGFNAGNAMARNKYIYTLADQALVIDSALGSGGTWAGALEDIVQGWVPLYVRTPGDGPGNAALIEKGAAAFNPPSGNNETLADIFARSKPAETEKSSATPLLQQSLLATSEGVVCNENDPVTGPAAGQKPVDALPFHPLTTELPVIPCAEVQPLPEDPLVDDGESNSTKTFDMFGDFSERLKQVLEHGPLSEDEVSAALFLEKGQTKVWIKRAMDSGRVDKLKNPVRYSLIVHSALLC
jgi:predicted Rossmann fold nucleotide-binding protein DprA/Smf involved in DNA uptake